MSNNDIFSIAEFAEFTRTTRDTLLHYDRIGLLSPESRGENNYRYYSSGQLAVVNLIRTCQALGMTLAEIKALKDNRTPELVNEILGKQMTHITGKIEEWEEARRLLFALKRMIDETLRIDEEGISVQYLPAERIVLGRHIDYSDGKTDYDALLEFYRTCSRESPELNLNYPVWGMFSMERVLKRDFVWPDRFYFFNPAGIDERSAGLYAIGYIRDGYGKGGALYERMMDYIESNDYVVCGPAFEEYPQNEVCVFNEQDYLMRVIITVRKKS